MTQSFPTAARIVVIGGGVIGTSIAFHLARAGEQDVVLLEKAGLTEGATWHAAGLVGQFRSQQNLMRLMNDSVHLYDTLLEETGQDPGWHKVGSLRLATSQERWKELLKSHSAAQAVGFEMNMLSAAEARELYPLMEIDDVVGAAFIPDDGHIDPNSLTQAFARGFRANGGHIFERTMVKELVREGNRITQVITDHGPIDVDVVVNAAGLWARQVGWMAGAEIPAGIVEHQYLVTEKSQTIPDNLPALRDPDGNYYVKPEPGALAIGGWESQTRPVDARHGFAWENESFLFDSNLERLEEFFAPALKRLPILNTLGIRTIINGPIPISPDGEPVMGPVPGFANFYTACAFTSGIAASGGAGKAMANWIVHGDPGYVRRFGALQAGQKFLHERAVEAYAKYYHIHRPGEEMEAARGVRRSPLYQTLKQQGAVFGSKFGWERANWFAHGDIPQTDVLGFERPQQDITVGREHRAARERVGLIDMSSFTKFEISGKDACQFLQYLAVANVDKEPGGAAYTQLCNQRGGIEADVTIIRRAQDCFWLITGSGFGVRDRHWLESNREKHAEIRDITSAYGVINLAGPLARKVLQKVCDEDLSHEAFSFIFLHEHTRHKNWLCPGIGFSGHLHWRIGLGALYPVRISPVCLRAVAGSRQGIRHHQHRLPRH